jgi:hypothetical protein
MHVLSVDDKIGTQSRPRGNFFLRGSPRLSSPARLFFNVRHGWHFWAVAFVPVQNQVALHCLLHLDPIHRALRQLLDHEFGLSAESSSVPNAVAVELFSPLIKFEMGLKFGFSASPDSVSARCPVRSRASQIGT